jgi:hypothetical protein
MIRIGRQDEIAVCRKQHNGRIDDVGHPGPSEQYACPAAQCVVERRNLESRQQPRQIRLPAGYTPPHLAYDASMGVRRPSGKQFLLD